MTRAARPAARIDARIDPGVAPGSAASEGRVGAVPAGLFLYGARGMLAGELLRLCELHPGLELAAASTREASAVRLHPHVAADLPACTPGETAERVARRLAEGGRAAVVFALPHGESVSAWLALQRHLGADAERVFVVDLAADFRLRDPERYARAYGAAHPAPAELAGFVYGLPELGREALCGARRAAAPGCFATAAQLAVLPAAAEGILDAERPWILNAVTGSSGSGNEPKPTTHHPHRHGNLWAYGLGGHRHEAELLQALEPFGLAPDAQLLTHSGPFARGIHLGASLPLAARSRGLTSAQARDLYAERYRGEPFVEVLSEGAPDLRSVVGSNRASLAAYVRGDVLHVLLTLDNLIKGGAGQALQCLNLMLGLPETTGLPRNGTGVC